MTLTWAPEGPGWPREGIEWDEAVRRCRYLAEDGLSLAEVPQDIWRLPTADEAVRSMHRDGEHSGGQWDGRSPLPKYNVMPDKETPLWNVHSHVIYWWTGTEIDEERAYMICYNGQETRRMPRNFDHRVHETGTDRNVGETVAARHIESYLPDLRGRNTIGNVKHNSHCMEVTVRFGRKTFAGLRHDDCAENRVP